MWTKNATPAEHPQTWGEAAEYVDRLNTTCRYGPGYGDHMMGYGSYGYGNLSPQDATKFEQSQQKFLNDTSDLRNSIQEKQFTLNQEIQQTNPDRDKVTNLQKGLSQLESQFDQIAPEHQLDLRKNFPENALSMGYGRGGYCW